MDERGARAEYGNRMHIKGGNDQPSPAGDMARYWPGYLAGGYFDESGNLRPQYVIRKNMDPLIGGMTNAQYPLNSHQLRRFFQHCRAIEARLKSGRSSWQGEEAEFRKLDVAAADASGKKPPKIPALFHDFIRRNVEAVKNEKDFLKGFLPHFEALVGFGAQYMKDSKERD